MYSLKIEKQSYLQNTIHEQFLEIPTLMLVYYKQKLRFVNLLENE